MTEFQTRPSLIARVRNRGDSESWNEFYRFYQPLLMRYLARLGLKAHDADDVTQDVFIRLLQSLPTFELYSKPGRFRTYLWKLTYSALVDGARRNKVRRTAEEEWVRRFLVADESESLRVYRDLEGINQQQILEKVLPRIRSSSSSMAWACFEQRVLRDRPASAISVDLGISTDSVYVHSSRVMKRLRRHCDRLADKLGDFPFGDLS
jgi:RNA polymerase sigma factor (sigma-70 family)